MNDKQFASVMDAIEKVRPVIERIGLQVWQEAELSQVEHKSAQIHVRELEAAGFKVTSKGACGYVAAFVAEWSQGKGVPRSASCRSMTPCPAWAMRRSPSRSLAATETPTAMGAATTRLAPAVPARRLRSSS